MRSTTEPGPEGTSESKVVIIKRYFKMSHRSRVIKVLPLILFN